MNKLLLIVCTFAFISPPALSQIANTQDSKCALIAMFAEKASKARDEKKNITRVLSNESPWNEIAVNRQKAIILMVSEIGYLMYSPPRIVAEKMYSECKRDPAFLDAVAARL